MSKLAQAGDSSTRSPRSAILSCQRNRFLPCWRQRCCSDAPLTKRRAELRPVPADQHHGLGETGHHIGERAEIRAFAITAGNQHDVRRFSLRRISPSPTSAAQVAPTLVAFESLM